MSRHNPLGMPLSSHTIGVIGEMVVCSDLLRQGWKVYRSVSPHADVDLVARRGGETLTVEVRSGRKSREGRISYQKPLRPKTWDVVAVVLPDSTIDYQPALPTFEE